jgi:AraC-like DNA-binding protein
VAQLPIVDVLSWIGSPDIIDRLLSGEVLRENAEVAMDRPAFARWTTDLASGEARLRTAVELEIQARLHRLVQHISPVEPSSERRPAERTTAATTHVAAAAIRYVVRHFMEHITIDDVAHALGRNHDYVMECFRRVCGLTLWEYVTRVRVGEAQRLLAATEMPVAAVGHRAGFNSSSQLYEAFHRYCGQTPARYREGVT